MSGVSRGFVPRRVHDEDKDEIGNFFQNEYMPMFANGSNYYQYALVHTSMIFSYHDFVSKNLTRYARTYMSILFNLIV
jgi:hypothetical protein